MKFWHAVSLVSTGRLAESLPLFRAVFAQDKNWATLVERLPPVGLFDVDTAGLAEILTQSAGAV